MNDIRYCTATSKRTHQLCQERAMRGRGVCYHHGGKSVRGIAHPNHKHGYYCKETDILLLVAFHQYCRRLRDQQIEAISGQLVVSLSTDHNRFMVAAHTALRAIKPPRLTPKIAAELMGSKPDKS